jgi:hypothetical protein
MALQLHPRLPPRWPLLLLLPRPLPHLIMPLPLLLLPLLLLPLLLPPLTLHVRVQQQSVNLFIWAHTPTLRTDA